MASCRAHGAMILFLAVSVGSWFNCGSAIASAQSSPNRASIVVPLDQARQSADDPAAEQQLLVLVNAVRAAYGLSPLRMDRSLRSAARAHSYEMATAGYVGHGSLSGVSAFDRLSHVARGLVGENVALGVTCDVVHRALIASPPHLANILRPEFHRIGIGVFTAGSFGIAVTQDFAE